MSLGMLFLESLGLAKMVGCRLNPLRVCYPAVVQNFASVMRSHQLVYCYTVIENNSRNCMPTIYQDDRGSTIISNNVLDSFFPFDPYILKRYLFLSLFYLSVFSCKFFCIAGRERGSCRVISITTSAQSTNWCPRKRRKIKSSIWTIFCHTEVLRDSNLNRNSPLSFYYLSCVNKSNVGIFPVNRMLWLFLFEC